MCTEHAVAVGDRLGEFTENTRVALVMFAHEARLRDFRSTYQLPYPVLADPGCIVYRRYGIGRGSVAKIWGLRTVKRYTEVLRRDGLGRLHRPTEDTLQLGGDFVIGPTGTLTYGHWGEGPYDRPPVDDLIEAVAAAQRR